MGNLKTEGTKNDLAGKAKKIEGKLTGDKAREAEGKFQEGVGKAQKKTGEALDQGKNKSKK